MIRRVLILCSLLIFSLILISCNSSNESSEVSSTDSKVEKSEFNDSKPVDGDWLIYHLGAEPGTLNPIVARDVAENIINSDKIYETLLTRDNKSLELVPLLAESWTISEDKLTFTFKLRNNVNWHDGKPFTSEDVVYSYNSIMNPKVDSAQLKGYYQEIQKVEALDDYTVKFTYARPYFLALEFCGGMPIVPKHIFEKGDFNKIITIDTPHYGSFLADIAFEFVNNQQINQNSKNVILTATEAVGFSLVGGAMEDLRTNSPQLNDLNKIRINVPMHTIVGDYIFTDIESIPGILGYFLTVLDQISYLVSPKEYSRSCFQNSDLVVPVESQSGLLFSPVSSTFNHHHLEAPDKNEVVDKTVELLNEEITSALFINSFPN